MKKKVILESNKETVTDKELTDVANLVGTIQETQKSLELKEEAVKSTKDFLRKLTEEDLPNKLTEIGLSSVETKNGDKVAVKPFYRGHISKEKQDTIEFQKKGWQDGKDQIATTIATIKSWFVKE